MNLGVDVPAERFIEAAMKTMQILCMLSPFNTTMIEMETIVQKVRNHWLERSK